MTKCLAILAIAILGSGCCQTPVDTAIGLPARPSLIPVEDVTLWRRVPLELQDTWMHNDLALKEYARKLESRIRAHDEMFGG